MRVALTHIAGYITKYIPSEPLRNTAGTFFGKIQDVPINYLMGTSQSHDWVHCECTGRVLGWNTAEKLAWKILDIPAVYQ